MRVDDTNVDLFSVNHSLHQAKTISANSNVIYNPDEQVLPLGSEKQSSARMSPYSSSKRPPWVRNSDYVSELTLGLELVATGSSIPPNPPIIVKRAILTGHPYRVHKKVVTMRYMFFNREDVLFYKPVQLVSKQGRRGWIKEALGTHGTPHPSPCF